MKTASVRDLRNEFGRISRWIEAGETVQVLKRGKPFAELVPASAPRARTLLNATPGLQPLPPDLEEPAGAEWNALK